MATIATHNGHTLSQGHNRRDPKYTSKDGHIKPNGHHEIWLDKDIKEMYHELFDGAVQAYNQEQKRDDRKIKDYYQKIKTDQKKHLAYETIIGIYKTDKKVSEATKKEILKEYCDTWEARNPNLKLLGVYYHADEQGEPHVHIDYIPVASHSRGMQLQNGMRRALEEQELTGKSRGMNPVKLWTQKENKFLEDLCNERGIKVEHGTEKKEHLSVREFQDMKDNLKKDLPTKKGLFFKRYSKEDLETLEDKVIGINVIEDRINMSIADIPQYLKDKDEERTEDMRNAWGQVRFAQNKAELLQMRLDEAQKEIKSLQAKNERLKQSNRDLLNELHPGEEKKRNREEQHRSERNHDDFDLER